MSISNFGGYMQMDGKDLYHRIDLDPTAQGTNKTLVSVLKTDSWPLPLLFRAGVSMDAYKNAAVSSDIAAARDKADLYGGIFTASAVIGGAALGLSPLLWTSGPSKKRVEASMRELQAQIDALQKATR